MTADSIQRELATNNIVDPPAPQNVVLDTDEKTSTDNQDSISSANSKRTAEQISTAANSGKTSPSTPNTSPGKESKDIDGVEGCRAGHALCSQYERSNGGWAAIMEAKVAMDRAEAAATALQNQIGRAFRAFSQRSTTDK